MYLASLVFHVRNGSPVSTYGEKYTLLAQNLVITALAWRLGQRSAQHRLLASAAAALAVAAMVAAPEPAWLAGAAVACAMAARVPQLVANARNGHTGVLSVGSQAVAVAGAAVRAATVAFEVANPAALASELLPLMLNLGLLAQLVAMRGATRAHFAAKLAHKKR